MTLATPATWAATDGRPNDDFYTGVFNKSAGPSLWECLNEVTPSDTDYVYGDVAASSNEDFTVGIAWCYKGDGTATLRVRLKSDTGETTEMDYTITLYQGAVQKGTDTGTATTSYAEYTASCSGITDYNNLNVNVEFTNPAGNGTVTGYCSWIEVDCT